MKKQKKKRTLEPSTDDVEGVHSRDCGEACNGAGSGVFPLPLSWLWLWHDSFKKRLKWSPEEQDSFHQLALRLRLRLRAGICPLLLPLRGVPCLNLPSYSYQNAAVYLEKYHFFGRIIESLCAAFKTKPSKMSKTKKFASLNPNIELLSGIICSLINILNTFLFLNTLYINKIYTLQTE